MKTYTTLSADLLSNGLYRDDAHGPRRLLVPDPTYVRRQIEQPQPDGTVLMVDDPEDRAPLIDGGPNPDTKIPADAIEITEDQYQELIGNRGGGPRKVVMVDGVPTVEPYTPPPPPLADVQAAVWRRIQDRRDTLKAGGVQVGTQWFHTDDSSRIQYLGLKDRARDLLAAGGSMADPITILGKAVQWKTMDGSFVPITAQLAFDIVSAVGDLDAAAFAVAETHRAAMMASPDPAAYDFSTGWPVVFVPSMPA